MDTKSVFRKICKGDGRGSYLSARGNAYCPYDNTPVLRSTLPPSPRIPLSPFTEKGHYEGTTYDGVRRCPARRAPAIIVHAIVFLAYTTLLSVLVMAATRQPDCEQCIMYKSPAKDLVNYKIQPADQYDFSSDIYAGHPRPELEAAWDILLGHTNVRLSEKEVRAVNRLDNAVALPDGGYAGTLNVFHELHCVRWLHAQLYSEQYFPNMNNTEKNFQRLHTEQCLTNLRKAALCHADVGVVTYNWDMQSLAPKSHADYQCANMEPLLEWTESRSVDLEQPSYIKHPVFGEVVSPDDDESLRTLVRESLGAVRKGSNIMR